MADGVINSVTLLNELKLHLNDKSAADAGFITDAEYERFIFNNFVSGDEQDFVFDKASTGIYVHRAGGLVLYAADFTAEDDVTYTLNPRGSIKVTAGTATVTQITVTGVRVDWDELLVEVLLFLANHRSREVAQALGDGNYDPGIVRTALIEQAEVIRGVTS